jgi:hypothetical protein
MLGISGAVTPPYLMPYRLGRRLRTGIVSTFFTLKTNASFIQKKLDVKGRRKQLLDYVKKEKIRLMEFERRNTRSYSEENSLLKRL